MKTCTKCGTKLGRKNSTGLCLKHRFNTTVLMPENFAELAQGKTSAQVAELLGIHIDTARAWAYRAGVELVQRAQKRPVSKARAVQAKAALGKSWCAQCDRRVFPNEAVSCRSQFCKAKAAA